MKKLLIALSILLLTGCSVDYNLTVTNKGNVKEKFYVNVDNSKILESSTTIEEYLNTHAAMYAQNQGNQNYHIKTKKAKPSSYFLVTRDYKDLDEYITSNTFRSMFNSASIERLGDYTTFITSKNAYLQSILNDELVSEDSKYDDFKISIKFYNEVIDTNADVVDEKNNVYTWELNDDINNSYIYFKISSKVRHDVVILDYVKTNLIAIIAISTILVLLVSSVLYLYVKSKKNNEV